MKSRQETEPLDHSRAGKLKQLEGYLLLAQQAQRNERRAAFGTAFLTYTGAEVLAGSGSYYANPYFWVAGVVLVAGIENRRNREEYIEQAQQLQAELGVSVDVDQNRNHPPFAT